MTSIIWKLVNSRVNKVSVIHMIIVQRTFVLIDASKGKEDMQSRASLGRTHVFPAMVAQESGTGLAPEVSIARQTASQKRHPRNMGVVQRGDELITYVNFSA